MRVTRGLRGFLGGRGGVLAEAGALRRGCPAATVPQHGPQVCGAEACARKTPGIASRARQDAQPKWKAGLLTNCLGCFEGDRVPAGGQTLQGL